MRRSAKRWPRPVRLTPLMLLILPGCADQTRTVATAAPECAAFPPLTYSKNDTDQTVRQIRSFDAARRALCAPEKAGGR